MLQKNQILYEDIINDKVVFNSSSITEIETMLDKEL
jgi:hypothetical protein